MPDNWGFVAAAYALAAVVLGAYWRMLVRKERDLRALGPGAGVRNDPTGQSREPSGTGHPRPEPGSRAPLQQ